MSAFLVNTNLTARQTYIENTNIEGTDIESTDADHSGVVMRDMTTSSRIGFRGPAAEAFLVSEGIQVPDVPNQAVLSGVKEREGLWVLRLSKTEFWLIDLLAQHTQTISELEQKTLLLEDVYRLYSQHSHAAFKLSGEACSKMFAKVCGVNLDQIAFPTSSIAQTSVARVNAIVVNCSKQTDTLPRYLVLSDISSSEYLWEALQDASQEFG